MTIINTGGAQNPQLPATSGTYTFSVARDDIIREAMLNLGVLEESEVPTAQETTDMARKLNMIVKQLAGSMDKAPGFKMWQRERGDLFLSPTQYSYNLGVLGDHWAGGVTGLQQPLTFNQTTLTANVAVNAQTVPVASTAALNINDQLGVLCGSSTFWTTISAINTVTKVVSLANPLTAAASGGNTVWNYSKQAQRPVEIKTATLRDSSFTNTPLTRMSLEVYEALPSSIQPNNIADPTAFYYEARQSNLQGRLYIDCAGAQDVTKWIHIVYLRQAQDFNNPGDAAEFPQEWFNHLSWSLTLASHAMFEVDWTQGMQAAYSTATQPAREANPQTNDAYFQPDDWDGN